MFQSITFYIGGKVLGIYGEEFPLGTLTTEVLNITPEEYQALDGSLKSAIEGMALYEKTHKLTDWHQVNEQMLCLNEALCQHRIFRLVQTDSYILTEAKQLTEIPISEGDSLEMNAHDREILRQICNGCQNEARFSLAGVALKDRQLAQRDVRIPEPLHLLRVDFTHGNQF